MASNRNIGLDYLRSLAILIVIANHCLFGFFVDTSRVKFEGVTASVSASAVIAIEWLFVLSGFLIGTMMIRSFEREKNWLKSARDFWLRRWFRTIPNYYLFVLINLFLINAGVASGEFEFKYFLFSQNLAWVEATPHFFGEAWSLALDEWFYLLMPLMIGIFGFFSKNKKVKFITTAAMLISIPAILRLIHHTPVGFFEWDSEIRRITIFHLDATGWGVLAAAINKWFPGWWRGGVKGKAFFGLVCMLAGEFFVIGLLNPTWMNNFLYEFGNTFSITLMAGGTFLMLPWLTSLHIKIELIDWIVGKLSLFSYSIYLVHFPLIFIFQYFFRVDQFTPPIHLFTVVTGWLAAIVVLSGLLFYFFEKPVADIRDSFTKRVNASPF